MNGELLKYIMTIHGETVRDLAGVLNISEHLLCKKIEENGSEFRQWEIAAICRHYNLSEEELVSVFFTK